jgi:hypothetical protein
VIQMDPQVEMNRMNSQSPNGHLLWQASSQQLGLPLQPGQPVHPTQQHQLCQSQLCWAYAPTPALLGISLISLSMVQRQRRQGRFASYAGTCCPLTWLRLTDKESLIREKNASSSEPPKDFAPSSSNTTLQAHMEREHKEDYIWVCLQKGWKNQLPSMKFKSEAGMEPADAGGQSCPAFSPKAFVRHLINFIIADDQVSKLCLHHLLLV